MKKFINRTNEYNSYQRPSTIHRGSFKSIKKSNKTKDKQMMKSLYLPRPLQPNREESDSSMYIKSVRLSKFNNSLSRNDISFNKSSQKINDHKPKYESSRQKYPNNVIGENLKKNRNKSNNKKSILSISIIYNLNKKRKNKRQSLKNI